MQKIYLKCIAHTLTFAQRYPAFATVNTCRGRPTLPLLARDLALVHENTGEMSQQKNKDENCIYYFPKFSVFSLDAYNLWYAENGSKDVLIYEICECIMAWKRGIKVADGIKVVNRLP